MAAKFIEVIPEASQCMLDRGLDCRRAMAAHRSLVEEALAAETTELECSRIPEMQQAGRRAGLGRQRNPSDFGDGAFGPARLETTWAACFRIVLTLCVRFVGIGLWAVLTWAKIAAEATAAGEFLQ